LSNFNFVFLEKLYDIKIVQIACEKNHVLALDALGSLYSWGSNDFGALGLGKQSFSVIPLRIPIAQSIHEIKQIYCGPDCSLVLLHDGLVYACGRNNANRLGFGRNVEKIEAFVSKIFTQQLVQIDFIL
jgi:NIMA (never in mitosis gene a)-related kinase 8